MSKLKWGVGGIFTLAVAAVGGNLYADKNLKTYYQQGNQQAKNLSVKYQNFHMGSLKGHADWTAELVLDPCKPKDLIKFSGQDTIKRSWNGYSVQSDIKITQAQGSLQSLLKEPLKAKTTINWLGTMHTALTTPFISRNEAQIQSRLEPITLEFHAKQINQQLKILDLQLEIPSLSVIDANSNFQMTGLKLETNQGLNGQYLESGKTKIKMDLLKMSSRETKTPINAELKKLSIETQSELEERILNTSTSLKLDEMTMPFVPAMQNLQLNFNVTNLNRQKLQHFFDLVVKGEKSCLAKEKLVQDIEPALLAVINEGFYFESKNNQFKMGKGVAKASMSGRIMPSHQSNLMGMVKMMPSLMEYKADVEFDKNIMSSVMNNYMAKAGSPMTEQNLENMLSTMQQSGQVKRDGDTLKMSLEYKFGEKKFLN